MPLSPSDESKMLKVWLQSRSMPFLNCLINVWHIKPQKHSDNSSCAKMRWRLPHARLLLAMLLHHTPSLVNFHGLLSMRSRMVYPCFWIFASFSQLAYSTRCPFHLTKYSKYSFHLLLLLTLLSSMLSICGFSTIGIYFVHWISGCSSLVPSSSVLYGYKFETLNIREIPIPSGNSIS